MNKIEFKDLPDTTTPIDASNLNLLQNNVEEAINANAVYSTNEIVIGKWINGKPIYRTIISNFTVNLSEEQQIINHDISNFENLINLKIYVKYSNTTFDLLSSGYIVRVSNSQIQIDLMPQGINLSGYTGYIIIEYTKTTD